MEVVFFAACAYVAVETVALPLAALRGRGIGRRWVIYLLMILVMLVTGLLLFTARDATVLTR